MSSGVCAGAFEDSQDQLYLARSVIFTVVYTGIGIALWTLRKKCGPGKNLLSWPFIVSVGMMLM